nr:ethylene-responsive transcription factor RAP2-4-like [Ipomoea batatas]
MAASMWSSSTAVDEPFNGGGPTIMSSDGCSTSGTHTFSSQGFTGFRFEQPGYIGLNQLTPTQIKQIQAQINQQQLPPHHEMSSAAKGSQCWFLVS